MVCLDDSVICVPKTSLTREAICLSSDVRCNGEEDCVGAVDEANCRDKACELLGTSIHIIKLYSHVGSILLQ